MSDHNGVGDAEALDGMDRGQLEDLAQASYRAGKLEAALRCWERLHQRALADGDEAAAGAAATNVAVYLMMDTGLMAPVRGWAAKARRSLDTCPEAPPHAWLAVVHTYERFMSGEMAGAGTWAQQAIDIGMRQRTPAAEAMGRLALGRVLIFEGRIDDGLALLDEAAVATTSGGLDPLTTGMVYCELICAMQGLAQYDRAAEWTDAMERWRGGAAYGVINGRCRVHRAEMLRLRGSCDDAEDEALRACEELRPWMRREFGWPLSELGTIRLRKGDLAGAEESLVAAHHNGWNPHPALALLRLQQGDIDAARALIADALRHPPQIPSKERPPNVALTRAPLLDAQVEIAVAAGDIETARDAAADLSDIAGRFRSTGLSATAALARARVALADGKADLAAAESEAACSGWNQIGAPYETAVSRTVMASACLALGNGTSARLELDAARATFEEIGAVAKAKEAVAALERMSGTGRSSTPDHPPAVDRRAPTGGQRFELDGDTRSIEFDGKAVLLRDLKGMQYLERLLAEPGRELHVLDLVSSSCEGTGRSGASSPLLDARAKEDLKRRLAEIDDDIDEATRNGDLARAALADADRDYLVRELARAFGIGGRDREFASDAERARTSVTRSLRYALARIKEHHASLGEHLERTIHTGTFCSYVPDPRVASTWSLTPVRRVLV